MMTLNELRKQAQPLYAFVYKYFEHLSPEVMSAPYEFSLSPVAVFYLAQSIHQQIPILLTQTQIESEIMDLWAHKELVLHALVVLTNLPFMYEALEERGILSLAVQERDLIIDGFTQKAIEDPNVLSSIQQGTIDEDIERLRQAKELYNFKPLFEQHRSLVMNPDGVSFQEIPERF